MSGELNRTFLRPMAEGATGSLPLRRIDFKFDEVYGPWIYNLKTGSRRLSGLVTEFLKVYNFDLNTNSYVTWVPSDFTITFDDSRDMKTRTFNLKHEQYDYRLKLEVKILDSTIGFRVLDVNNFTTRFSTIYVEWPRFKFTPFGSLSNHYVVNPFTTGFVLKGTAGKIAFAGMPDEMQFAASFDSTDGTTVLFRFDDLQAHVKSWYCTVDSSSITHLIRHHCDRRFQANYQWKRDNYTLHVEVYKPSVRSGYHAPYKAAEKYRTAMLALNPPWLRYGNWSTSPVVSSDAKAMDGHFTFGGSDFSRAATAYSRIQTHVGFVKPFLTCYQWRNLASGGYDPDPSSPASGFTSMVTTLQAASWGVLIYMMMKNWSRRITSTYNLSNYSSALDSTIPSNLTPYLYKDKTGAVRDTVYTAAADGFQSGETYAHVDYYHSTVWPKVYADVARRTMATLTPKPNGCYFDANGSFVSAEYGQNIAGTDDSDFQDDPDNPSWTHKANYEGRDLAMTRLRSAFRESQSNFTLCSEWPQEHELPLLDFIFNNTLYSQIGVWSALFHCVYGDYTRFSAYTDPQIVVNDISQNLMACQITTVSWLRSGVVTFNDATQGYAANPSELVASPITGSQLYYYFEWMRLLRVAFGYYKDYFKGRLVAPVVDTWLSTAYQSETASSSGWQVYVSTASPTLTCFSETWQKSNGDLGILVADCYLTLAAALVGTMLPSAVISALYQTLPTQTITISVDTTIDGLNSGTKSLYKTVDGTRTLLGTFVGSISVTVTIDHWTVTCFEVVHA